MLSPTRTLQGVWFLALLPAALRAQGGAEALSTHEAVLMPANLLAGDRFGKSVAIYGDTAVGGSPRDTRSGGVDAGSAYVFVRSGTTWSEEQQLIPADAELDDRFGFSSAIWGDTIVVGAPQEDRANLADAGAAYVFVRSGSAWIEQQKLTAGDGSADDRFGFSVALWQDTIVVGALRDDSPGPIFDHGSAYVFVRSGTTWTEEQKLMANDRMPDDRFGVSVDVEGDTALVGAFRDNTGGSSNAGSAYVFVRSGTGWSFEQKLVASDGELNDNFGRSVVLSGETALIGAPMDGNFISVPEAGSAYVFVRSGASWSEEQKLESSDGQPGDAFGEALDLSGDMAVVGAPRDDMATGTDVGSAYTFTRSGTTWSQQEKLFSFDANDIEYFGLAISIMGDTALIGVPRASLIRTFIGAVYVFRLGTAAFEPYCTAGTSASGCQASLSASGLASISAPSGFTVTATGVEGSKDGGFFFGTSGKQAHPWGNGTSFQCVVPPVTRTGLLNGVGTLGLCDGILARDLNAFWCPTCTSSGKAPPAGILVQTQLWYRDPQSTSNQETSLSNALEFLIAP